MGTDVWMEDVGTSRASRSHVVGGQELVSAGVVVAPGWQMAPLISPQGEKEEMGPLSGLETESKQKDAAIRDLQEETAAMAKTLAQVAARNEVELTQKLLAFDQELEAKAELIRALREQVLNNSLL